MTYVDHVAAAAKSARMPAAHIRRAVAHLLTHVFKSGWKTGRAQIPGFLNLRTGVHKARRVVNPQTGELMTLPAEWLMGARVAKRWRRRRG